LRAHAAVLQRNKNWHRRIDESLGLGCLPSVPGYSASYPGTVRPDRAAQCDKKDKI
jgi:hypothetical protein